MITFRGEKYACRHCIRGHRSSTCGHTDRALYLVRKRGRPQTSENGRIVIEPSWSGSVDAKSSSKSVKQDPDDSKSIIVDPNGYTMKLVDRDGKTLKILDPPIIPADVQTPLNGQTTTHSVTSNDKIHKMDMQRPRRLRLKTLNDSCSGVWNSQPRVHDQPLSMPSPSPETEYVFVPAGNGLFRRELASHLIGQEEVYRGRTVCAETGNLCPDGCECGAYAHGDKPKYRDDRFENGAYSSNDGNSSTNLMRMDPPMLIAPMHMNGVVFSDINSLEPGWSTPDAATPQLNASHNSKTEPLVESADNRGHSRVEVDLDVRADETAAMQDIVALNNQLDELSADDEVLQGWIKSEDNRAGDLCDQDGFDPTNGQNANSVCDDIVYVATCVIPGECECDDDCQCYGCSTHNPL